MSSVVADALQRVRYGRTNAQSTLLWQTSLATAIEDEEFLNSNAAELVALVLVAIRVYDDRHLRRAVLAFSQAACQRSDTFLKQLAAGVVKAASSPSKLGRHEAFGLLALSRVAVQKLDPTAAKKAVAKLIEIQTALSEQLSNASVQWKVVSHVMTGEAKNQPAVTSDMTELAKAPPSTASVSCPHVLARVLLDRAQQKPDLKPAMTAEVLNIYCDKIMNGRDKVTADVAASYNQLFKNLTSDDVATKVLPAVTRSLRRTPEVAMTALSALLEPATTLDISGQALEIVTILVQQMRVKETIRPLAVSTTQQVAARTLQPAALGQCVALVKGVLDGSAEGKIKVVSERLVLSQALTALASSPAKGAEVEGLSDQVVTFAANAAKEEANDEAKGSLLACMAAWLAHVSPSAGCIQAVKTVLSAGIADTKETTRRQALRTAAQLVYETPGLRPALSGVAEACVRVLSDALTKPAIRLEGVLAFSVLGPLTASSSEADGVMDKAGAWTAALKPDATLFSVPGVGKLPAPDTQRLAQLLEELLLQHAGRLAAVPGAHEHICRLLAGLCLHYDADVRKVAREAVSRVAAGPRLLRPITLALAAVASAPSAILPLAVAPEATGEDAVLQPGTVASRLAVALKSLLPRGQASAVPDTPELDALLLASHHPVLFSALPRKEAARVWSILAVRMPGLAKALPGMAAGLSQALLGPLGVASDSVQDQKAAMAALGACMALAPTAMFPYMLEGLAKLLDRNAHDALTQEELDIWATPPGILSSERVPEGAFVAQVVENKNVRKARGRFKTDYDDDDEPAPASRKTSLPTPAATRANSTAQSAGRPGAAGGAAGGKKDAAARQAEWRQATLDQEAQVRARVNEVRRQLELGCDLLCAVVAGNPRTASLRLEQLQEIVLPLLASPIAGEAAFRAVRSLASCLPNPFPYHTLSTAAALRLVTLLQSGKSNIRPEDVAQASQAADVIKAFRKATGDRRPLPGPAYRFLFPVLEAVLSSSSHTPLHDDTLAMVALHCGPGSEVPRKDTLALLHYLLGVIPAYRDRVAPLLKQLCAGSQDEADMVAAATGVLHAAAPVRAAALASLYEIPALAHPTTAPQDPELVCLLLLARFDVNEDNAQVAQQLWDQTQCSIPKDYVEPLVKHVTQTPPEVQQAAATALSTAAKTHPGTAGAALSAVIATYLDGDLTARRGCATALKALAPDLNDAEVTAALDFLIGNGLADHNDKVREEMVAAGTAIVDAHGAAHAKHMLPLFESYLDDSKKAASRDKEEEAHYDLVREGVVVFLGTLARHLAPDDPKRGTVVDTLVTVLGTPSEAVQRAVSSCLSPLMVPLAANKEAIDALVARLLNTLTKGKTYGERRGAAFGLAGLVKGLGIMSMKNCGIMDALKASVEDKKDPAAREGALLAFECLSDKLGKLFEPYIIHILPLLLNCFGDTVPQVRAATEDAARMIMGQLSASGVKLVLPSLLKGLEDKVWRTKQGSVQLLGSMAHCAPRQLGSCLPTIVPRLSEVLSDPHPKVQAAANEALKEIGSVIRNPEVSTLVPSLMAAIADPNAATRPALDVLLETVFVNTIDAASLALIVPVIHRGLRDRTGDTKKRAARIAGNMASLVNDPKDMVPYVPLLRPELQKALVDPLPEVRAFAARAMGSLMQGMGTEQFGDLVPWLMTTLRSESSSVERSGAAQGLAEVMAVLGRNHLDALLPDLLAGCGDRTSPIAREGHLVLLQYLPVTLEDEFQPYLGRFLPAVLDGLADESEGVRDAALAAGRILVDHYANSALELLLPAIEEGLFGDNWRIRQSSVKLLGKLLFKVAGTSGNVVLDGGSDDEGAAEENYNEAIINALGMERRNEVLSRLYMMRSDPQYPVRTEALHVWKSVVPNTPRTLGQVLPTLMALIIDCLASDAEDRQTMAGRCVGELVRKMGERVLGRIIPILVQGVGADNVATRQGVCLGMKEVLENIGRHQLADILTDVLPAVQAALCDEDAAVREAAGAAFSIMFRGGAGSAVDSVVPAMLEGLSNPSKYTESVEGLRVILGVRPQMLNSVLPKLTKQPLQLHALHALKELASVSGPVLQHHIKQLFPPLLTLANKPDAGEREAAAKDALAALAAAVPEEGVHLLLQEMRKGLEDPGRRIAAAGLVASYAVAKKNSAEQLLEFVPQLLDALISLFAEPDLDVVGACWRAVEALCALIPKEDAGSYVRCVKEAVATAKETERRKRTGKALLVAGLCLPKALSPLLPIYLQGVLAGATTDIREMAAEGLGELVSVTSEEAVKPYVVQITGPLIRIIGDRFPSQVKSAILVTLGVLIAKAGVGLKPFVPQLQTTFVKSLADPADSVRIQAAANLGELSRMSPRVEQLATELATAAKAADPQVRDSYLLALKGLFLASGDRLSAPVLTTLGDSLRDMAKLATGDEDKTRFALAACLGALTKYAPDDQLKAVLTWGPLSPAPAAQDRPLHACVLATVARYTGSRLQEAGVLGGVMEAVTRFVRDPLPEFRVAAGRAAARVAAAQPSVLAGACNVLSALLGPEQSGEVQRQALLSVRRLSQALADAGQTEALEPFLPVLVPNMCAIAAATVGPTKMTCELSLARVLHLENGVASDMAQRYIATGPGSTVRNIITEPFIRRVGKMSEDEELFNTEEY